MFKTSETEMSNTLPLLCRHTCWLANFKVYPYKYLVGNSNVEISILLTMKKSDFSNQNEFMVKHIRKRRGEKALALPSLK